MTKAAAAARFLALATAANKAGDALWSKYVDAKGYFKSVAAFQAYEQSEAVLVRRFADNLRKSVWPAECAGDIKLLLKQSAAEEAAMLRGMTATTWDDANKLWDETNRASNLRQGTSNLVRADLGLPSVPIPTPRPR